MTLTRRGTGYALNGNPNEIARTLNMLLDAYQRLSKGSGAIVFGSMVAETRELQAKLAELRGERNPETANTEQEFAAEGVQ